MKKIAAVFTSIFLIVQTGKSQISTSTGQSGSSSDVSFTLGSFGHWRLAQPGDNGTTTKRSYFILETGDGGFFADLNSSPSYIYNNLRSGSNNSTTALITLSGRYDTIKPPPIFAKNVSSSNGTATLPVRLSGTQKVKITPIASELNSNDEMLYVLTYRVPENAVNAKIIFIYKSPDFNVFENCDNTSTIAVATDPGSTIDNVNRLRTYFGETWGGNSPMVNIINGTPGNAPTLENTNNASCLSWTWDASDQAKKYLEHNIFISLKTKDNLPVNSIGYIEAALLYTTPGKGGAVSGDNYNNKSTTSLQTLVSGNPHDPNYIIAVPHCTVKQPAGATKKIDYRIHFQNEGNGQAQQVIVTVYMDSRLKRYISNLNNDSFTIKVGHHSNPGVGKFNDNHDGTFKITIPIAAPDSSLASNRVQDWFVNPITMGDISFQLEVPIDAEADFIAKAGIVFTADSGQEMDAVHTNPDTLFIRKECNGMLYPGIPPIKKCNCKKLGPLCWYWWVAIGVGVLFLIWFIGKRKRRKEKAGY